MTATVGSRIEGLRLRAGCRGLEFRTQMPMAAMRREKTYDAGSEDDGADKNDNNDNGTEAADSKPQPYTLPKP